MRIRIQKFRECDQDPGLWRPNFFEILWFKKNLIVLIKICNIFISPTLRVQSCRLYSIGTVGRLNWCRCRARLFWYRTPLKISPLGNEPVTARYWQWSRNVNSAFLGWWTCRFRADSATDVWGLGSSLTWVNWPLASSLMERTDLSQKQSPAYTSVCTVRVHCSTNRKIIAWK